MYIYPTCNSKIPTQIQQHHIIYKYVNQNNQYTFYSTKNWLQAEKMQQFGLEQAAR